MAKIFINYRREDSEHAVDRIFDAMSAWVEDPALDLFMDVDRIPLGVDFIEHLDEKVRQCDLFLAIIGKRWLHASSASSVIRRLDEPNDFVRLEIKSALDRHIPVVPVLLDGAKMPSVDQLPVDLRPLARRNAAEVSRLSLQEDVNRMMRKLPLELKYSPSRVTSEAEFDETKIAVEALLDDLEWDQHFEKRLSWSAEEAYLAIILEAYFLNDQILSIPKQYLQTVVGRCRIFRSKTEDEMALLTDEIFDRRRIFEEKGQIAEYLNEACNFLPSDMHKAVLAQAADLVLIDGQESNETRKFLQWLVSTLQIEYIDAKNILTVMLEKNRF